MPNLYTSMIKGDEIKILSHLADADGLASQLVLDLGFKHVADYLGISQHSILSERIMQFSKDPSSEYHIANIKEILGDGFYVIADLATFDPTLAPSSLKDLLVIDHHPPKRGHERFYTINPHLRDIDGEKDCSGSIGSFLAVDALMNYALTIELSAGENEKIIETSSKYKQSLDKLGIIALAGANADMQEIRGINSAVTKYLQQRKLLKIINHPFYGHATKPLNRVLMESTIPFNLKYAFNSSGFKSFTDDYKGSARLPHANNFLMQNYFDIQDTLLDLSPVKLEQFKNLYSDNLIKFADPELKHHYLKKMHSYQSFIPNFGILGGLSVPEAGNLFTSLSKLGHGNLIKDYFESYFFSPENGGHLKNLESYISHYHKSYKQMIAAGMLQAENIVNNNLGMVGRETYSLNMDSYLHIEGFTPDILRKLVGVYGGLICNTRLLPNNYGVLFTRMSFNEEGKRFFKISGRYSDHPKYDAVDLGKLMENFGGGGHKGAASCVISADDLDDFHSEASKYIGGRI